MNSLIQKAKNAAKEAQAKLLNAAKEAQASLNQLQQTSDELAKNAKELQAKHAFGPKKSRRVRKVKKSRSKKSRSKKTGSKKSKRKASRRKSKSRK